MSILERMRGSTDSTPMQIVLILIVVAFVGWYALPQGEKVQVAVEVNGERVLVQEFGLRYGQAERMMGRKLDESQAAELAARVKEEIARELVLTQEAIRLGYHVSAEEIGRAIKADPAFHDRTGKFNKDQYDDSVKGSGRSRADFETDFRDRLLRDKLHSAVALGVTINEAELKKRYQELASTIDLETVRVSPAQVAAAFPISDSERSAWIAANIDAIRSAYDEDKAARYDLPERVTLRTIRLPITADDKDALTTRMEAIKAEIVAGASFVDLARRWSEDGTAPAGGDMGERRVPTLTTQLREAIADVPEGQVSAVLDEGDRLSLYQVVQRTAAEVVPVEAVQDQIADRVMQVERAEAYAKRIAAAWTGDSPPMEVLAEGSAFPIPMPSISPAAYQEGPDQPPVAAIEALADAEPGTVVGPFAKGAVGAQDRFVVRLTARPDVDWSRLESFRQNELDDKRQAVWEAYGADLQSRAMVNTGGGEATQGGWQEYFAWLLPE